MSAFKRVSKGKLYISCEGILSQSKLSNNVANNFLRRLIERGKERGLESVWDLKVIENIPGRQRDQEELCSELNRFFDLNPQSDLYLGQSNVILPYTLLKKQMALKEKDGCILVCGEDDILKDVLKIFGIKNFITMDEYTLLYPFLVPISGKDKTKFEATKEMLYKERGIKIESPDVPHKISSVFILQNPSRWEEHCQVICDLLSTNDGSISKKFLLNPPDDHIPIYFANEALQHFSFDRNFSVFGLGMMKVALNTCYKLLYRKDIYFDPTTRYSGVLSDYIDAERDSQNPDEKIIFVSSKETFEDLSMNPNLTNMVLGPKDTVGLNDGKSTKEISWAEALNFIFN